MPRLALLCSAVSLAALPAWAQRTETFVPITPCRQVDTRTDDSGGPLLAGVTRNLRLTGDAYSGASGSPCVAATGVPVHAKAVALNLTLAGVAGNTNVRAAPWGTTPSSSYVNASSGFNVANAAVIALADDGSGGRGISVVSCCATTHLIVDLLGYFTDKGHYAEFTASFPNVVGGATGNNAFTGVLGATISGGGSASPNVVWDDWGTIGGGHANTAGDVDVVTDDEPFATVGGGSTNWAGKTYATVGGGSGNSATGFGATIGGGENNIASGTHAAVPGGSGNSAAGANSFAAGHRAKANSEGTFVFADSTDADFDSSGPDKFLVRASNGAAIYSSSGLTTGVVLAASGGSWASVSDRSAKADFTPVNGREILERLVSVPIETWRYKGQDASIRHIGPMAQDFHAAFGVGEDERHITTVDSDGVALAAIQGLYELLLEKEARIARLEAEVAKLARHGRGRGLVCEKGRH